MNKILKVMTLLCCLNLGAQEENRVKFGIKGGINFDSYSAQDSTSGSQVGGDSAMSYFGLLTEIRLKEFDFLNVNVTYAITSYVNLIQVPLHYRKIVYKQWSAFAGPQFDFIINDNLVEIDEDIILKKYGFTLATGVQKEFGNNWLFEVRYSAGVTNILEDLGNNLDNLKINELRFGLGYNF